MCERCVAALAAMLKQLLLQNRRYIAGAVNTKTSAIVSAANAKYIRGITSAGEWRPGVDGVWLPGAFL